MFYGLFVPFVPRGKDDMGWLDIDRIVFDDGANVIAVMAGYLLFL